MGHHDWWQRTESELDMDREPIKKIAGAAGTLANARSGLPVLTGFIVVLCSVVWFARAHDAAMPAAAVLSLICFSFGWTFLSICQVLRGGRKLGGNRSNYTQLLSGSPPDDPDMLFVWRWTLQCCYAILAVVLCVIAIAFAT